LRALYFATAVVSCLGAVGACSLTTSFDDLTAGGGMRDGAGADVETGDGPSDAAVVDAASLPRETGVDAATPFRCADHADAVFCADFETDPFDRGWDEQLDTNGSYALIPARSSRGLSSSVPARADDSQRVAAGLADTVVMTPGTSFTYSFDILLGATLTTANIVDFGGFVFHGPYYSAVLRSSNGDFYLQEYGDATGARPVLSTGHALTAGPKAGVWSHVEMRFTFAQSSSHAVVKLDGATVLDGDIAAYQYASTPHLVAGITNVEGHGTAFTTVIDDVLATAP
jgi:hypothetical protein